MLPWAAKVEGEFEVSMELPPSNPDFNRSPSMLESDQSTAGSADVRLRKNWPLLLIFGFLGLLAGPLVGGIYFTICPKVYQSQATISIRIESKRKDWSLGRPLRFGNLDIRHDQLIGGDTILAECLIKYLKDLPTLRDLSAVKQIQEIQKNLVVVQNREEPTKYQLEYFSTKPRDAQTVLATIISTYEKRLEDEYPRDTSEMIELLEKVTEIEKQLKMAQAERSKLERFRETENGKPAALTGSDLDALPTQYAVTKKAIALGEEIDKLILARMEAWDNYQAEKYSGPRPYLVIFNQLERPQRGRQVRPVLALMLPGLALIGAVVGFWFAYLGLLVVGANR